jgi:hypothetical protein
MQFSSLQVFAEFYFQKIERFMMYSIQAAMQVVEEGTHSFVAKMRLAPLRSTLHGYFC